MTTPTDITNVSDVRTNGVSQAHLREQVASRVRRSAQSLGWNSADLASRLGLPSSSMSNYWTGKRMWPTELLVPLAEHLQTRVATLLGAVDREGTGDLVAVSEIDLAYGMGGSFADGPVEAQTLHFPRAWLETITTSPPSQLTFARGRGDSMVPTLLDGDIVLIDRSQRTVREQDAIWAFTVGDIAMIKRVRLRGETVHILSDNDRVPADEASIEEVHVVGRVVFIGRRL